MTRNKLIYDSTTDSQLHFEAHLGKPLIIAGDFNATLTEQDVGGAAFMATPSITPEERECMIEALKVGKNGGLVDIFRWLPQNREASCCYTRWGPRCRGLNLGRRIDFAICSRVLADHLVDAYILDREYGFKKRTDHAPVGLSSH